jgi:hypothetical protein
MSRSVIAPVAVALLAVSALVSGASAQRPIRIFLAPIETRDGFVDEHSKRQTDSRLDLQKRLNERDKTLVFVENQEAADLTLRVVSSKFEKTGEQKTEYGPGRIGTSGSSTTTDATKPTIRVELSAGEYSNELIGVGIARWIQAADDVALQTVRWIKDNKQRLLAK